MLDTILRVKKREIQRLALHDTPAEVRHTSLYDAIKQSDHHPALIAEVKKASPSKGVIRQQFDPVEIATAYEAAGASAISVLTDETFFQGHLSYISLVKNAVRIPVLRKDFMLEEIQLEESKIAGADAVLLIAAALKPAKLARLYEYAHSLGLEVLVEVHNERELINVLEYVTPTLLGINNRDLTTFTTNLETTKRLAGMTPRSSLLVSESGISSPNDMRFVGECGVDAALVGEALMREDSLESAVRNLLGEAR